MRKDSNTKKVNPKKSRREVISHKNYINSQHKFYDEKNMLWQDTDRYGRKLPFVQYHIYPSKLIEDKDKCPLIYEIIDLELNLETHKCIPIKKSFVLHPRNHLFKGKLFYETDKDYYEALIKAAICKAYKKLHNKYPNDDMLNCIFELMFIDYNFARDHKLLNEDFHRQTQKYLIDKGYIPIGSALYNCHRKRFYIIRKILVELGLEKQTDLNWRFNCYDMIVPEHKERDCDGHIIDKDMAKYSFTQRIQITDQFEEIIARKGVASLLVKENIEKPLNPDMIIPFINEDRIVNEFTDFYYNRIKRYEYIQSKLSALKRYNIYEFRADYYKSIEYQKYIKFYEGYTMCKNKVARVKTIIEDVLDKTDFYNLFKKELFPNYESFEDFKNNFLNGIGYDKVPIECINEPIDALNRYIRQQLDIDNLEYLSTDEQYMQEIKFDKHFFIDKTPLEGEVHARHISAVISDKNSKITKDITATKYTFEKGTLFNPTADEVLLLFNTNFPGFDNMRSYFDKNNEGRGDLEYERLSSTLKYEGIGQKPVMSCRTYSKACNMSKQIYHGYSDDYVYLKVKDFNATRDAPASIHNISHYMYTGEYISDDRLYRDVMNVTGLERPDAKSCCQVQRFSKYAHQPVTSMYRFMLSNVIYDFKGYYKYDLDKEDQLKLLDELKDKIPLFKYIQVDDNLFEYLKKAKHTSKEKRSDKYSKAYGCFLNLKFINGMCVKDFFNLIRDKVEEFEGPDKTNFVFYVESCQMQIVEYILKTRYNTESTTKYDEVRYNDKNISQEEIEQVFKYALEKAFELIGLDNYTEHVYTLTKVNLRKVLEQMRNLNFDSLGKSKEQVFKELIKKARDDAFTKEKKENIRKYFKDIEIA